MLVVKNPPANAGDIIDVDSILGSGRSPGGGHGNPLQYSNLENPMDRGTWKATVHRVTKSQIQLKRLSVHTHKGTLRLVLFFLFVFKRWTPEGEETSSPIYKNSKKGFIKKKKFIF